MFLLTVRFVRARAAAGDGRRGVVAVKLIDRSPDADGRRGQREFRLSVKGADKSVINEHKDEIIEKLRLLYCVIERRDALRRSYDIDDVAVDFRKALDGDISMADVIERAKAELPLRADLVSVGREFKGCFKYIYARESGANSLGLTGYINDTILTLRADRKTSVARAYDCTLTKLQEYTGRDDIAFDEIDKNFIDAFARWLKTTGISDSTQSFYLRSLRSVLNRAEKDGRLTIDGRLFRDVNTRVLFSPVKNHGASDPDRAVIRKIETFDLSYDRGLELIRDMFMFGFYCRGMELVDIAHLTRANIRQGYLVYRRRLKGKEVRVPIEPAAAEIVDRYKGYGGKYLFPLLYSDERVLFASVRGAVIKAVKEIGRAVGFPQLTFYMNITAWKSLLAQSSVSNLLLAGS